MFTASLFTIAKTCKQPKCPWIDEWINKVSYTYTMEYYSDIKSEIMPFLAAQMDLKIIKLSEVSQRQISYDITYMWNLKKKNDTNEIIYKTHIDSQSEKTNLWLPNGKEREGYLRSLGPLYIKHVNNKHLLYSTETYAQYFIITYKGKESEKKVCVCV